MRLYDVLIQPASLADASAILDLQRRAYQSEAALYDDDTIAPLTQTLAELEADFQQQFYLKAVLDGTIVGAVRGYERDGTCFIGRLIVHPDCQNRGLGTQLLRALEAHFPTVQRYELFTGTGSARNLHLYQKQGYRLFRTARLTDKVTLVYLEKTKRVSSIETMT
ncbi:amino-acid N-acetyltransferase [Thermoflexales bacterium]|nr:amino-acid N-acetyltransferase [Thermoflexales bacterium]